MEWLVIDEEYLNYLRNYEERIPRSDYGRELSEVKNIRGWGNPNLY